MEQNQSQPTPNVVKKPLPKWIKVTLNVLLVVVVCGAAGYGVYAWKQQEINQLNQRVGELETKVNQQNDAPEQQSTIPDGWVEYKNEELGFSFAYPEEWLKVDDYESHEANLIALRSPESQKSIDNTKEELRREAALYLSELIVTKEATAEFKQELEKLVLQHEHTLECPDDYSGSNQACHTIFRLIDSKLVDGVRIYEATEGGFGKNYAVVFKKGEEFIKMSFRSSHEKKDLTEELKQLINTLSFS